MKNFILGLAAVICIWGIGVATGQTILKPQERVAVITGCEAFYSQVLKAADVENWERAAQMSTLYLACRERSRR